MARQAESFARSLLSPEPSKHHESSRNLGGVCRRDLSSGISRGDTSQELSTAWNAWQLSSPIVLVRPNLDSYLKPFLCLRENLGKDANCIFTSTSNMPIMLQSALSSNIFLVSQMLYSRFSDNLLVKLLGIWEPREGSAQLYASSGIAYYVSLFFPVTATFPNPETITLIRIWIWRLV